MASGGVRLAPLVTSTVGLDGLGDALQTLTGTSDQIKILVDPAAS